MLFVIIIYNSIKLLNNLSQFMHKLIIVYTFSENSVRIKKCIVKAGVNSDT